MNGARAIENSIFKFIESIRGENNHVSTFVHMLEIYSAYHSIQYITIFMDNELLVVNRLHGILKKRIEVWELARVK